MPGVPAATPNLHVYHPERAFILIQTATPMLVKPRNAKYDARLEAYSGNLDLTADGQSIPLHFDISIPMLKCTSEPSHNMGAEESSRAHSTRRAQYSTRKMTLKVHSFAQPQPTFYALVLENRCS